MVFTKGDKHMANKHMKRCAASSVIREMQILITVRCRWMPIRMAEIKMEKKNLTMLSVGKHEKHENAQALLMGCTLVRLHWKKSGSIHQLKICPLNNLGIPLLAIYATECICVPEKNIHNHILE